ncbi:lactosylceramide 4-alpha-galactosyltransferase-like isoform X1 [Drosophila nasuta]|uniref:lactosylceramide 4-alpha-galactosyltransferase-like isoform X1 n=1 Tax=Drosophila nasuta TaxID=42062 RepID=UPI00295EAD61|nr:lactosylceramide 4-alpha-galactosyltransferase-like isoform X1 [Drosophila nasuta]
MSQRQRTFRARLWNFVKLLIVPLFIINICELLSMRLFKLPPSAYPTCYSIAASMELTPENISAIEVNGPIPLEDILLSEEKPTPGMTIFFLETSCPCSENDFNFSTLSSRQACAIESAALHNPNLDIYVIFACPHFRYRFDPIMDVILSYRNIRLRRVNLWRFGEDTPLEDWMWQEELFSARFLMNNISNLLRLLCLYHFGGIYMDLDVIVLRSFENQLSNFVGAEAKQYISNAVIGLESNGFGHKLAELLLRDFEENFNGDIWAHNGPRNILSVMTQICGTNNVSLMETNRYQCQGVKVFNHKAFFEIQGYHWAHFFEPKYANKTLLRLRNSYLTHIWNRYSTKRSLRVDSNAAYIQLARRHCPRVLAITKEYFD